MFIQEPDAPIQRKLLIVHISSGTLSPPISSQSLGLTEFENWLYPTWSPDGTQIALYDQDTLMGYMLDIECQTETYQCLPGETAQRIPLSENIALRSPITWSPDGSELAAVCVHREDVRLTVCVFNGEGKLLRELDPAVSDTGIVENVTWSPDGSLLAFDAKNDSLQPQSIYIINTTDMSLYAILSSESEGYGFPTWVP